MSAPDNIAALFDSWLADRERQPTDTDLAPLIASLDSPARRRAARLFAKGFLRGCDFCTASERERSEADLAVIEGQLGATIALVRAFRERTSPESTA